MLLLKYNDNHAHTRPQRTACLWFLATYRCTAVTHSYGMGVNLGGAYSSLFVGVFSNTSAVLPSTASSILGEPESHRALRGLAVGPLLLLLLVDLARDARAVHPAGRVNRTTNALVQLGNDAIDTTARGSSSCFVVGCIVGSDPHVVCCCPGPLSESACIPTAAGCAGCG